MKRRATKVSVVLLIVIAIACASAEKNAYRTLGSLSIGVDFSMNAWGDWVRSGRASAEDEAQVKAAYIKYQEGMATLKVAVLTYKTVKESGGVTEPWVLATAIAGATDFAFRLVNLINSFRAGEPPLVLTDFGPEIRDAEAMLFGGAQ